MDEFKREMAKDVGKRCWHCYCCEPAPKDRQKVRREARRRLKQKDEKIIKDILS